MTKRKEGELKITNHDYEWNPKYYGVIVGLFCGLYMITIVIAPKLVNVYGLTTSAGILTFPLCAIITDLMTEIYGFNRTRQAVWTVLVCLVLCSVFTKLAILMTPAELWTHQAAFETIFDSTWRFAVAGIVAWPVGEFSNSYVMSKLKIFQNAEKMSIRFIGSTIVGQFADTLTYSTIAFAGVIPWSALLPMLLVNWGLKVGYEVVVLPISTVVTKRVKRLEGVEHFDKQKLRIV